MSSTIIRRSAATIKEALAPVPRTGARALALTGIFFAFAAHGWAAGFIIIPTFDSTITSLPAAATIESTIRNVIAIYEADLVNPITVNIKFANVTAGLGASSYNDYVVSYTNYISALQASKTSPSDTIALAHLSTGAANPVTGASSMLIKSALAKALGLGTIIGIAANASDGTVSVNTSSTNLTRTGAQDRKKYDLQSVLTHEIDEILGLGSTMGQGFPAPYGTYVSPEDLFRYSSIAGTRSYTTTATATAFFSLDGATHLEQFINTGSGDYGDWALSATVHVQDVNGTTGAQPNLNVELTALDVIGYTLATTLQK